MITPTLEEFKELAAEGNLIPVCKELIADQETPLSVYQKLTLTSTVHTFLLESVEGGEHLGRFSFVGFEPKKIIKVSDGEVIVHEHNSERREKLSGDPLTVVEKEMARYRVASLEEMPRFIGGAVGYFGYEYLTKLEPVPRGKTDDLGTPDLYFMLMDSVVVFDRVKQSMQVVVNAHIEGGEKESLEKLYEAALWRIEAVEAKLRQSMVPDLYPLIRDYPPIEFHSNTSEQRFEGMVVAGKRYIQQGDVIQVVLSQRFDAKAQADPLTLYRTLRTVNPSPYMFLMQVDGFSLIGSSPEIHVRCEGDRVEIRPIAGTRPRGKTIAEDLSLEQELLVDEKERAEHLMLVDLARNDIGRVCETGSVNVPEFMTVERYSHVMHIVSQVEGTLRKECTPFDLLRATFPAGTVSGAPKIRAAQIIAELEASTRGPYAGAVGYFGFSGNLDSCITIRTILHKDGRIYIQTGAGIVADSVPENEYQETVNKAKGMFKAVALANALKKR